MATEWVDKVLYWAWYGTGSEANPPCEPPTVKRISYAEINDKEGLIQKLAVMVTEGDKITLVSQDELRWWRRREGVSIKMPPTYPMEEAQERIPDGANNTAP